MPAPRRRRSCKFTQAGQPAAASKRRYCNNEHTQNRAVAGAAQRRAGSGRRRDRRAERALHGAGPGRGDEFRELLLLRQDRADVLRGPAGERDREPGSLPPRGAHRAQPVPAHGAAHAQALRSFPRIRPTPSPPAATRRTPRWPSPRDSAADERPRNRRRGGARAGARAASRHPDQLGGGHHGRRHHLAGAHGVLVRRDRAASDDRERRRHGRHRS